MWIKSAEKAFHGTFSLAKCLCLLHCINTHVFSFALLVGPSMLPVINPAGTFVMREHISPRFGRVGRGDIVGVRSPENPRKVITKRVKGVEGDIITFNVEPDNNNKCKTVVVPKGHVWIEGDYVYNSRDSRTFGAVPYGLIECKVFWQIWPLEGFGPLGRQ